MTDAPRMKAVLCLMAGLLCSSCVSISETDPSNVSRFADAVPFCELMTNRQTYVGRDVSVRAFWVSNHHGSQIFDDGCPQYGIWVQNRLGDDDKEAASIRSAQLRSEHYPEVVLRGALQRRQVILQCEEDACFEYIFGNFRLVAARRGHAFRS